MSEQQTFLEESIALDSDEHSPTGFAVQTLIEAALRQSMPVFLIRLSLRTLKRVYASIHDAILLKEYKFDIPERLAWLVLQFLLRV